jgi:hypothetical protein
MVCQRCSITIAPPKFVKHIFYNAHASPTKKSIYSKDIIDIFKLKTKKLASCAFNQGPT